jgi:iron complex outermembrane recepter protein
MRRALSLSASVLALVCGGAAVAPALAADNSGIETVVVTAERRTENLMTTPISADVISGQDLQAKGVISLNDLQFVSPALTIDNFGQGVDFNIRGIGKGEHNAPTTTGVITYRDGTPTFPGYMTEEPYYDVASIEVLRGPQGTFVGQNATGGAVFVTTNNPDPASGYNGYAMAQAGNYSDFAVQGALNIPVSDTFAMRVALDGESRDSFYTILDRDPSDACAGNKYAGCKPGYNPGNQRYGAGRVSVLWKPIDALTLTFKTDVDYLDNGADPADSYADRFAHVDLFHITQNAPLKALDRFVRSVLRADYVFADGITLRSVSSYQHGITEYAADLDGTDASTFGIFSKQTYYDRVNETIWTQEFNLISPDDQRFTWILGAFAQADRYGFAKPYQLWVGQPYLPGLPPTSQPFSYLLQGSVPNAAWAVFGQAGYKLTPDLQVQLGGRWSANSARNDVDILQYGTYFFAHQKTKSYSVDYKASVNYSLDESNFLYAFVATGYKPGGLNVQVFTGDPALPFGPERVMSYEAGWKATMLDGHIRTTLDGYYNDYKGFQVIIGYPLFPTFGREVNVPNTTTIYGMEAEIEAAFGPFSISAGIGLNHSELGAFYAVDPRTSAITTVCDPSTGSVVHDPRCEFLGGHPQTYAPSVTGNIGAQYIFDVGGGDTLTPRLSYAYQSGQWATLFDKRAVGDRLGARDIVGAQLEWKHDTWLATLYGGNLLDQHYVAALNSGLDFAGPPRQFGVRLTKLF